MYPIKVTSLPFYHPTKQEVQRHGGDPKDIPFHALVATMRRKMERVEWASRDRIKPVIDSLHKAHSDKRIYFYGVQVNGKVYWGTNVPGTGRAVPGQKCKWALLTQKYKMPSRVMPAFEGIRMLGLYDFNGKLKLKKKKTVQAIQGMINAQLGGII
jgi:hypothetical protein